MSSSSQSPRQIDHLEGPSVLLARPGRVVGAVVAVSLAVLAADYALRGADTTPPEAPDEPATLTAAVTAALDQSDDPETVAAASSAPRNATLGPKKAAPKTGLVNLIKRVADAAPEPTPPATVVKTKTEKSGVVEVEDPGGAALRPFYDALRKTKRREVGAVTRIVHFGDSTIVADLITGSARRKFQKKFGDAGHGFVLVGKPWSWYVHDGIEHDVSSGWRLHRITSNTIKDHRYGLGGVTARTRSPRAWVEYGTVNDGPVGTRLSRVKLYYLAQPGGGKLDVNVDGEVERSLDTKASGLTDKVEVVDVPDGPHTVRVAAKGDGEVRIYGVALERQAPGVIYDSLGISGIRAKTLARSNRAHFTNQVRLRGPHLVILMMGTNESEFIGMSMKEYERDFTEIVDRVRDGAPGASCLVAGPPDRGFRNEAGRLVTHPMIPKIIEVQRRVAAEKGCGFWDTFEAMGGESSMVAWFRHKPRLGSGDFTHFTKAGGDALGVLLFDALVAGL